MSVTDLRPAPSVGPPPPFDPELAPVADALAGVRAPDAYRPDTIVEMRRPVPGVPVPTDDALSRHGAYRVDERTAPGPDGNDIALLVCVPQQMADPVPAIYFIHGGGMIVGDNRFGLPEMLDLAEPLGMAVVSVEYRLAPETPHPGPVEDCYAGLVWVSMHADDLGIDPERIVVGGMSAGGGLAGRRLREPPVAGRRPRRVARLARRFPRVRRRGTIRRGLQGRDRCPRGLVAPSILNMKVSPGKRVS